MERRRWLLRWIFFAAVAIAATAAQWAGPVMPLLQSAEFLLQDNLRARVARDDPEDRITVVDIDEASIAALGPWPWPRVRLAELAETLLAENGARAVGFDIVFPAPADAAGDQRLAALSQAAPLVLAQVLDFSRRTQPLQVGNPVLHTGAVTAALVDSVHQQATGFIANHAGLAAAPCVGNIGTAPDADGRIRRVPLAADWGGQPSALLPLAMLDCPLVQPRVAVAAVPAALRLAAARWQVPYTRKWDAYTVVRASEVLDGSVPQQLLRGRWVLVGSSALGLNDRAPTPLGPPVAGVMVHAAVLSTLLDRMAAPLAATATGRWAGAAWATAALALAALCFGRFRAWWLLPGSAIAVGGWLLAAAWLVAHGFEFNVVPPLLAWLLVLLVVPLEWARTQRDQSRILRSFATYVAPSVLQQMLQQGIEHPMEPQHREITVISADMQNYTGLTAGSSLQEGADLTRGFLQCLTAPVLACGGTLDKYTGDGLVAFWGAPLPSGTHAVDALRAARGMVAEVRRWNEARVARGLPPARVRLGLESGKVLVGDLGTPFRRTYTAVGDCINLASKLQAAARNLPHDLVIGPTAAAALGMDGLAPVGTVQFGGQPHPSTLWAPVDLERSVPGDAAPAADTASNAPPAVPA